jgi:hypothetical protein
MLLNPVESRKLRSGLIFLLIFFFCCKTPQDRSRASYSHFGILSSLALHLFVAFGTSPCSTTGKLLLSAVAVSPKEGREKSATEGRNHCKNHTLPTDQRNKARQSLRGVPQLLPQSADQSANRGLDPNKKQTTIQEAHDTGAVRRRVPARSSNLVDQRRKE